MHQFTQWNKATENEEKDKKWLVNEHIQTNNLTLFSFFWDLKPEKQFDFSEIMFSKQSHKVAKL